MSKNQYSDRAKQFMPFDALKGLQNELRKKEAKIEDEKDIGEETYLENEYIIDQIDRF